MSSFPTSIYSPRTKENLAGVVYDASKKTVGYVEDITKLDDEVVALENLFGKNDDAQTTPIAGAVLKGKADGKSKWSTEIFIGTAGNVGVGITDTTAKFAIKQSADNLGFRIYGYDDMSSYYGEFSIGSLGTMAFTATNGAVFNAGASAAYGIYFRSANSKSIFFNDNVANNVIIVNGGGKVGVATDNPTAKLDLNSDIFRVRTAKTPASAGAAGNAGDICWDSSNLYVCVATNTWKKVGIATW